MTAPDLDLLPGVPEDYVRGRLSKAGGKELKSGKFFSEQSSAALAANAFAWFHQRPASLPPLPGTEALGWPALRVEIEYCARFPWRGGSHPWLDAFVETDRCILGIESKRHEPFRDYHQVNLSSAYDRPVWGISMGPFESLRDSLRSRQTRFNHLDAAQLLKHAFGLVTEANRQGKSAILVYLYAEPSCWAKDAIARHRQEIDEFARIVGGAAVHFISVRWREWLDDWTRLGNDQLDAHAQQLIARFQL